MKTNISYLNRGSRTVIGLVLMALSVFALAKTSIALLIIGAVLVVTGLIGFCPIDHYFHMKQRP